LNAFADAAKSIIVSVARSRVNSGQKSAGYSGSLVEYYAQF
jgi:hypothetical protein